MSRKSVPEVLSTARGYYLVLVWCIEKKFCNGILKEFALLEGELNISENICTGKEKRL